MEWYAAKILQLVQFELQRLDKERTRRKPTNAKERRLVELCSRGVACELGATVERVIWKFTHEEAALKGHRFKDQVASFQKSGTATRRRDGDEIEKGLEPKFLTALAKSSKVAILTTADIMRLMRKGDAKALKKFTDSKLRRYVERLLKKHGKKDSTPA